MRSIFLGFVTVFIQLLLISGALAGQLQDSLTDYKVKTQEALASEKDDLVKNYL